MQVLEFILIFSTLLGVLALLSCTIHEHHSATEKTHDFLREKWLVLGCSSRADAAVNHFVLVSSNDCLEYDYALNPPHSPFALVLGGDANHYN